jgi:hypothetical protein
MHSTIECQGRVNNLGFRQLALVLVYQPGLTDPSKSNLFLEAYLFVASIFIPGSLLGFE